MRIDRWRKKPIRLDSHINPVTYTFILLEFLEFMSVSPGIFRSDITMPTDARKPGLSSSTGSPRFAYRTCDIIPWHLWHLENGYFIHSAVVRLLKCYSCQDFMCNRLKRCQTIGSVKKVSEKGAVEAQKNKMKIQKDVQSWSFDFLLPHFLSGLHKKIQGPGSDTLL
jgi:hypothetical protein